MADERKLSQEEQKRLDEEAQVASEERDLAMDAAAESAAREAIATEIARTRTEQALRAQTQANQMNTMRQAAQSRADHAETEAESNRFGFYMLLGIIIAVIVVTSMWLLTRTPQTEAANPTMPVETQPAQPLVPQSQPSQPTTVVVPVPSPPVIVERERPAPEKPSTVIVNPPARQENDQPRQQNTQPQAPSDSGTTSPSGQ